MAKLKLFSVLLFVAFANIQFSKAQQWSDITNNNIWSLNSGNVGIGTTAAPLAKLHINGTIRGNSTGGALRVQTDSGYIDLGPQNGQRAHIYTNLPRFLFNKKVVLYTGELSSFNTDLFLQTSEKTRMTILSGTGNVGIGTQVNPRARLEVYNTAKGGHLILSGNDSLSADLSRIDLDYRISSTNQTVARISSAYYGPGSDNSGSGGLRFYTRGRGAVLERMRIDSIGNIGIGKTLPTEKLDVAGNIQINANGKIGTSLNTVFSYNDLNMGHYSLSWVTDSWNTAGATLWQSAWAGMKFFTNGLPRLAIANSGKVGIGTLAPDELLTVNGVIHAREVKVDLNGPLADYVFDANYKLMPLHQVEQFVKTNNHLPEIPSAEEVSKNGMNMGEMQNKLLQKIEELTLYVIEQDKKIERLEKQLEK